MLTAAGSLGLTYRADNGLLSTTTLGDIATTHAFNSFGEPSSFAVSHGAVGLFSGTYARDDLGRISTMSETVAGQSSAWGFTYDDTGRLTDVGHNGQSYAHYTYDANGNRIASIGASGATTTAFYDAQDRLTRHGTATYAYTRNGELTSKTEDGQVTSYRYDALGALIRVTKPGGSVIDYVTDAAGRRAAKKDDGALTRGGYAFGDALSWLAPGPGKIGKILKIRNGPRAGNGGGRGGTGAGRRTGDRTEPENLSEKLTLDEARAGSGDRIMKGRIADPRYPEHLWAKKRHTHRNPDGSTTVIHYWENLSTGQREGFKFK